MLDYHKETGADCTIAVLDVPIEEASRFGIMSTNPDGSIYKFTEKPKNPDSTKASMGIYIFTKKKLFDYLIADADKKDSSHDFGKDIIPSMLAAGEKMFAYEFSGYWKDVGTISSLWEANMDLLGDYPNFSLHDEEWRIYSRNEASAPQFVGDGASIHNSIVSEGCEVYGTVVNSVLFSGVKVARGAYIKDCVVMSDTSVGHGATVKYSILDCGVEVGAGAAIGKEKSESSGITVVGSGLKVASGAIIGDNEMISEL